MKKIGLKSIVIIIIALLTLSVTTLAAEVRPVLLEVRKAERSINKADREIKKAESEFRFFDSEKANESLKKANNYLEEAKKFYDENNDKAVEEFTAEAVNWSLKAILGTYESLPVQVRGLWLDSRTIAASGGRQGLQQLLNQAQAAGFNLIIPEVFYRGQTIIPSNELFVQDQRFSDWNEDPLKVIIEEASHRKMEVHGWVWVFNENTSGEPGIILKEHPDWANRNKGGDIVSYHNSTWLSPASEEVRDFLIERYLYLVENYELDGINLDYIRFPEEYRASYGFDSYTVSLFKEKYGIDPYNIKAGSPEAGKWNRFREGLITEMVADTSDILRRRDPELIISADVIPGREEARFRALQNWDLWLNNGYLDFVLPMTYTDNLFNELSSWLREENQNIDRPLYPGISVFKLTPEQVVEQVLEINKINPVGMVLFAAAHLNKEHYQMLAEGPFREEAVIPYTDREKALSLIVERIRKRIDMLAARKIITEEDRDRLVDNLYNPEKNIDLLKKMEKEGKQDGMDILRTDFSYLQKIANN